MTPSTSSPTRPKPVPYALPPDALEGLLRLAAHVAITNTASLFLEQCGNIWPLASIGLEQDAAFAAGLLLPDVLDGIGNEATVADASHDRESVSLLSSVLAGEPGLLIVHRFPVLDQDCYGILVLAHPVPRPVISGETSALLTEICRQIALRMEARQDKRKLQAACDLQASLRHHVTLLSDPSCVGHCIVNVAGQLMSLSESLRSHLQLAESIESYTGFEQLFAFDSTFQDFPDVDGLSGIPWNRVHDTACVHRSGEGHLQWYRATAAPVDFASEDLAWSVALLRSGEGDSWAMMHGRQAQTILIAEDHPVNQRVIQGMVEKLGLRAEIVSNGLEAVHAVCHRSYAAILMDCQMPEMDGIEATLFIRSNEESIGRIPIVAVTAFGQEDDRRRCLEAGVDEFMVKPIRMESLAEVLRRLTKPDEAKQKPLPENDNPASRRVEEALERLRADLDTDVVRDIIHLFLEDSTTRFKHLETLAEGQRWQEVRDLVHKIKGSCSSLGARDMVEACEAFEAERHVNQEILRQRVAAIVQRFAETVPLLQRYLQTLT